MKRVFAVFVSVLFTVSLLALTPQKIYFQAVIRDSSNNIVVSHSVGMQISILQGSVDGTAVYLEVQTPTTDLNGIVSIEIGGGIGFSAINWSTGSYFIKTETDPTGGTNYTLIGTSQLISVPYALHSHTADSLTSVISETDPVFFVSPAYGITSTNITDWNSAYSWGNHAGLYSLLGHTHPYLPLLGGEMWNTNVVTNLNADLLDGQHGSYYAPASIYPTNGLTTGYLPYKTSTTLANSPIHVTGEDNLLISTYKGANSSGYNIFIGNGGQNSIGDVSNSYMGTCNVVLGFMAGTSITTGYKNVAIGTLSSENLTTGFYNTAVGDGSMRNNMSGSHNVAFGGDALNWNTTGQANSAFGVDALQRNTVGHSNTALGNSPLVFNTDGSRNVAVGTNSLFANVHGNYNTAIGTGALYEGLNNYNVGIGGEAGRSVTYGNENIYIGYWAGYSDLQKVDANNSIAIGSYTYNNADNQVVLGNSLVEKTWLRGSVGINTDNPNAKLDVKGNGNGLGMAFAIHDSNGTETYSITDNGEIRINGSKRIATQGAYFELRNNATGATTLESDGTYNLLLNPVGGNVGIGVTDPGAYKLKVNGTGYFNGSIDATSYKLSGVSTFLDWTRTGYAGTSGQYLKSQGTGTTPVWTDFPTIPAAQVNSDWDSTSGVSQISNKPNLSTYRLISNHDSLSTLDEKAYSSLTGKPDLSIYRLLTNHDSLSTLQEKDYSSLTGKPDLSGFIASETDPKFALDSSLIKTGVRDWNKSLAKTIDSADTTRWGAAPNLSGYVQVSPASAQSGNIWMDSNIKGSALQSTVATGTAPLTVSSTTKVDNLNADLLDGNHAAYFQPLLTNPITGTGTVGYIPKFSGTTTVLANSPIYTNGSNIGINTSTPSALLDIKGTDQGITQAFIIRNSLGINKFSIGNNGLINLAGSQRMATMGAYIELRNNTTGATTLTSDGGYNLLLNPVSGNIGIGVTDPGAYKLKVNGTGYFSGIIDAPSYKLSGVSTFLDWTRAGNAGIAGQVPISQGNNITPIWKSLTDAGIASASVYPASGLTTGYMPYKTATVLANSPIYTKGSNIGINNSNPSALLDIKGTDQGITQALIIRNSSGTNTFSISNNGIINLAGSQRMATQDAYIELRNNATGALTIASSVNYKMLLNPIYGNVGIGYTTENVVTNNKLAVNGSIFANGVMTATGGNSTNWNAAYSWGNHAGLYRPISYVPAWSEITSNPFSFSSVSNNQLLKYNSTTLKWENWTPNFLTSFTETDPGFTAWDKSSGININASQVSDFQTSVTNNAAVLANTAKNSYPTTDATKLSGIAAGAEVNVNADWNATSGDAQILNKPTIPASANPGDMQYWNGTAWVVVPAGLPGQFLQFTASNIPAWTTVLPILTTTEISTITNNSAASGGNIASSGGGTITARGVCWSTSSNPTLLDNKTLDGTGTGLFTSLITGLNSATTYYLKAYATNGSFIAYGNQVSLTTAP